MELYNKLYIGDSLQKDRDKIIENIKAGKQKLQIHCITLPANPHNLLEIIDYHYLMDPHYKDIKLDVIGIAGSREEAIHLVSTIITIVYEKTNAFDIKKFLGYDL